MAGHSVSSPPTIWLTGLPASGKTTLAQGLHQALRRAHIPSVVIDGDEFRGALGTDLGYTLADRQENIRRAASVARMVNRSGVTAICAFVSPTEAIRAIARAIIGAERFVEVYVSTPLRVCRERDPKGLYRGAGQGLIADMTGMGSPFEPPPNPRCAIDTELLDPDRALGHLLRALGYG